MATMNPLEIGATQGRRRGGVRGMLHVTPMGRFDPAPGSGAGSNKDAKHSGGCFARAGVACFSVFLAGRPEENYRRRGAGAPPRENS